jgi:hypothetical protein
MQYLGTNELGFDAYELGFPSVKTCQAIVYQTKIGLFGLHDALGNIAAFPQKCSAFAAYVQETAMDHANYAECVIGVITREHRFGKASNADWTAQLLQVAAALGFGGDIWGARLESHVGSTDSAYIRFDRRSGGSASAPPCKVSYKRWSKMELGTAAANDDRFRRALKKDPNYRPTTYAEADAHPQFSVPAPEPNKPVNRQGRTDEGGLNLVTSFQKFR